ncbi:MAG: GTPase Era [Ruminococcaceae bacterium]|nr:GTPase Era [Oscillospiraceae bacterium]
MTKSVFTAIVGRPNVGKSTLINALVGQKVAIVSKKPQTTRNRITGVITKGDTQFVFTDTPGMHLPKTKLGEYMVRSVNGAVGDVDVAVLVVEPDEYIHPAEASLLEKLKKQQVPVILAINKTDVATKEQVAKAIVMYTQDNDFAAVVPLSALRQSGVEPVFSEIEKFASEAPWYFDSDDYTNQPEREMAAEVIREKLLRLLDKEVPHGTAVEIDTFDETQRDDDEKPLIKIAATIHCEKASHKGIIIGKNGEMLKRIRQYARADMEMLFDCRVNITCWVKVDENWRDSNFRLKDFGFKE